VLYEMVTGRREFDGKNKTSIVTAIVSILTGIPVRADVAMTGEITLRGEVTAINAPAIVATGPLTSDKLAEAIRAQLGVDALSFYDAIAPIVARESIDDAIVFRGSRYGKETMEGADDGGAYLNCPMTREQYDVFLDALISADQYHGHEFDEAPYFEGCMPVEVMAQRGRDTLRFGPLKPVGLRDPRTGRDAHAVVQLRQEDRAGRMWNMVGFQTRLRIPEQQRVLKMIPGLEQAEFLRYGSIHRNSYLNSPAALSAHLAARDEPTILFAGQITGLAGPGERVLDHLIDHLPREPELSQLRSSRRRQ